jgi:threonine synthase
MGAKYLKPLLQSIKFKSNKGSNLKGNNIVLATAHPCKFPDAILKAINLKSDLPDELKFVLDEKENYSIIDNNLKKIKQYILGKIL